MPWRCGDGLELTTPNPGFMRLIRGGPVQLLSMDAIEKKRLADAERYVQLPSMDAIEKRLADAEVSEDDNEIDSEDMDDEFIEALQEVLEKARAKKKLRRLSKAAALEAGSAEQVAALRAIWLSLTDAQRKEMVECTSSEDESEEEASAAEEASSAVPEAAPGSSPLPPPARCCPRGHELTAVNSKPSDYAKMSGKIANCDVCNVKRRRT